MNFIIFAFIIPKINSKYFSTATPYRPDSSLETRAIFPNNYKPVYVRYIGRHGSRFMSTKHITKTIKLAKKFSNSEWKLKYFNLSDNLFDLNMEKRLSESGWKELYSIGKRYMQRFSKMLGPNIFRKVKFRFESTCKSRSYESMEAFIAGMFEGKNKAKIPVGRIIPCELDTLYRFYDFCEMYKSLHECLDEYEKEERKFLNKEIITNITYQINQKLKHNTSEDLTPSDITTLYILCAYKRVVNGIDLSDWTCSLFDNEALNAFEYLLDLKQFYKKGNAHEINLDISCQLFKETVQDIKKYLSKCNKNYMLKPRKVHGTFGFSHGETLLPILGSFGLFDSSNKGTNNSRIRMNSENFEKLRYNRTFRAGYFAPMGGNVMFAVACPTNEDDEGVVMALLNEIPVSIPCCKQRYINNDPSYPVCTKEEFIECFAKKAEQCDFSKTCSTPYECEN